MFAVVDVETTGGYASGHRMTEIAIVVHDGIKVVERYQTLLNPQRSIPLSIQTLTGITPEMVEDAPAFPDVADEIQKVLGNHIFVAHNVNFDYSFVKAAFEECGISYNPKRLCSVRYARRIEKGLQSYSLRNLCKQFNVVNESAHRAWGDADATAEILGLLLEKDTGAQWQHLIKKNAGEFNLPANLPSEDYQALPSKPGVYYFLDKGGKPIYIGKASNLKKRVSSHFISDKETSRSQAFKREIHAINFELTGSELLASLLEDHEIRQYWPKYNRAQKHARSRFAVYTYENQSGAICMVVNKVTIQHGYLKDFYSHNEALAWIYKAVEEFELNPAYCGIPEAVIKNDISREEHNERVNSLLKSMEERDVSCIIKTTGREEDEDGFALIDEGRLAGIGFVPHDSDITQTDELRGFMRELRNSITTKGIIDKVIHGNSHQLIRL